MTRSPRGVLLDERPATFRSVPPARPGAGGEVVDLAASVGLILDPPQADVIEGALGERADGRWSTGEVGVVEPRQNGKGSILEARALGGMFLFREPLIVWSAHEFKTAKEGFLRLRAYVDNYDHLRRHVKAVRVAAGDEGIELTNGTRVRFLARSGGSGRGFSGDTVILDEAYALTEDQMAALLPTVSARPNPQIWYTSSAPLPISVVLRRLMKRGRAGGAPGLAYFEWCAPDDAHSDDRTAWAAANPALGVRISEEAVERERASMDEETFRRERLGIVDLRDDASHVIPPDTWAARRDPGSQLTNPVAFGVAIARDRSYASIAVGGRRHDGLGHGEVVDRRRGTGWVVGRLSELAGRWRPCAVVLDPSGPAGALVTALNEKGFAVDPSADEWRLHLVGAREYAQACGALADDVVNDQWRHLDQTELNDALAGAGTRPLADAWAWSRKDSTSEISPIEAVTLARHGFAVYGPADRYDVLDSIW